MEEISIQSESIGRSLGRSEREILRQRMDRQKNFVRRLNEVPGLVATYLTATDTIKWETRDIGTALTVRIKGKPYTTRHMEFHGIRQRAFYLFALPEDEMKVFTEGEAETLEIL
jgi:hypothetical protein